MGARALKSHSPIRCISNVLVFVFPTLGQSVVSEFRCGKRMLFMISLEPESCDSQPVVSCLPR